MEAYHYEVALDSALGGQLSALLTQAERCEQAADELAQSVGSTTYLPDEACDYGGILAFRFPDDRNPNPRLWDEMPDDGRSLPGERIIAFAPHCEIREEWMPDEVAQKHQGRAGVVVSRCKVPFGRVAHRFTRQEAARWAGITLEQDSIQQVLASYGIYSPKLISALQARPKEVDQTVHKIVHAINERRVNLTPAERVELQGKIPPYISRENESEICAKVKLAIHEDIRVISALTDKPFRLVQTLTGPRKAVKIYARMIGLPIVMGGTLARMLGVEGEAAAKYRIGLQRSEDGLRMEITSPVKLAKKIGETKVVYNKV